MAQEDVFKKLVSHCKEYGFVFPSSEIYDGLGAVYDYGQMGVELKNNIKQYWWQSMVLLHENIVGIDSAIFMHPTIWKASGHVDAFNDPLIDNRDSKKRYRADVLIEDQLAKYDDKINKEVAKAAKRFGEAFDEAQFRSTNGRVLEHQAKRDALHERFSKALNDNNLDELRQIILDEEIVCPISGTKNWTEVRQFNLMFSTEMGSTADGAMKIYLRPETAQGIFVNYLNVQKTGRMKIPFGIAQIGKAFRNEIVARQFIFRMREFEQMEMQFFVKPGTELDWFKSWKATRLKWHKALGFGDDHYRYHDHDKLAHYANAATDIEFLMPFGFKEVEGIHSRTNFDLSQHEKFSGKNIKYFDPETNESYTPYVIDLHPAATVMRRRGDGNPLARDVDADGKALFIDVGEVAPHGIGVLVGHIEIDEILAPLGHLAVNGAGRNVARSQRAHGVIAVHELLAVLQPQDGPETAHRLGDEEVGFLAGMVERGRMELDELHVFGDRFGPVAHGDAVARGDFRIARDRKSTRLNSSH